MCTIDRCFLLCSLAEIVPEHALQSIILVFPAALIIPQHDGERAAIDNNFLFIVTQQAINVVIPKVLSYDSNPSVLSSIIHEFVDVMPKISSKRCLQIFENLLRAIAAPNAHMLISMILSSELDSVDRTKFCGRLLYQFDCTVAIRVAKQFISGEIESNASTAGKKRMSIEQACQDFCSSS